MNGTTSQAPTVHSRMKKQWQLRQEGQPGAGSQEDPGKVASPACTLSSSVWATIEEVSALSESDDSQESSDSVSSSQKSREIQSRRSSYRKILSELSAGDTAKGEGRGNGEAGSGGNSLTTVTVPAPVYQTSTGQYIAITPAGTIQLGSAGLESVQGLQALTVTSAASARPGAIVQLSPTADGQHLLVPSNQVVVQTASGDVQTYQIRPGPGTGTGTNCVPQTNRAGEARLKREIRLMKNREAARQCRKKKKEYVKCLENRVLVLENQNKTLIEELKALKELYCQKTA